ncbi:MAG: PaaI family thioesterase [Acidimicrobiales bacterium]
MTETPTFEHFDVEWTKKVLGKRGRKGIDAYLGIEATEFTAGRLVAGFDVTDELVTMIGNIHGGCISALVDHVLGVVMYPVMPPRSWAATTEFKINLLAPVTKGRVEATAQIIAMSKRLAVIRIDVENVVPAEADGEEPRRRLVAVAQGTSTIVAPRD